MVLFRIQATPSVSDIDVAPPRRRRARPRQLPAVQAATVFEPQDPTLSPEEHFPLQSNFAATGFPRFINRFDSREILLVVDGSCVNNGRHADAHKPPVGGCSFLFKNAGAPVHPDEAAAGLSYVGKNTGTTGTVAFRLERLGPTGQEWEPTSNRAKLRAVIAALQFRTWECEGWRRVVILTDLEYIVDGATRLLPVWVRRGWRKPRRQGKYANRDLWKELQAAVDKLRTQGCEVSFWYVKSKDERGSKFITDAKAAAREAARTQPGVVHDQFTKLCGIML